LLLLPVLLVALVVACSNKGSEPNPPPDDPDPTGGNAIWVDSIDAALGSQVELDVSARIETITQGLTIPLIFDAIRCHVDSISVKGTLLEVDPEWNLDTVMSRAVVVSRAYAADNPVQPDSGVLFRVYISFFPTTPLGPVEVDTTTITRDNGSELSLVLVDNTVPIPKSYVPEFHPGVIRVTN